MQLSPFPLLIMILNYCVLKIEKYVYQEIFIKTVSSYEETFIANVQNFVIIELVFA